MLARFNSFSELCTAIVNFTMYNENEKWHQPGNGGAEGAPLFSRSIKAGKRMYYIDVKRDRRDEYYVSLTESKRVQDGSDLERPVFEKHKIFLYREDLIKFLSAFTDAMQYVGSHRPLPAERPRYERTFDENVDYTVPLSRPAEEVADESAKIEADDDFTLEF